MNKIRPYLPLLLLLLGACTAARRYEPPAVAVPTAWKNAAPAGAAAPAPAAPADTARPQLGQLPALLAWWTAFNDTTLARLETQVLAQNFTAQAAVARIEAARAQLRLAEAQRAPVVALNPSAYRTQLSGLRPVPFPVPVAPAVQTQYYLPLNASYEVDVWGRLRRQAQAAQADLQAAEADDQAVRLSLTADASVTYYNLRGLDAERLVLDSARVTRRRNVALTRARYQAGVDNEIGLRRAETELATVDAELIELSRQRAGLEAALATLAGRPASAFVLAPKQQFQENPADTIPPATNRPLNNQQPKTDHQLLPAPPAIPTTLPAALLARRPDLRRQERQLAAADLRLDAARLARRPTVQLNGFIGPQSARAQDLPKLADNYTYYLGGGVAIPLFDGGRLRAGQSLAEAQRRGAEATYRAAALAAYQEVETALADVQAGAAQLAAQRRALRSARLAGALTLERYRRGLSDFFAVVDADRQTLDAARLLAQTQTAQLRAAVQLVRALGGGWQ